MTEVRTAAATDQAATKAAARIWARATAVRDGQAPRDVDDVLPGIHGRLALDGATLLLARRDGILVGFALAAPRAETLELFYLAVDPAAWGAGVASLLLSAVDERARAVDRTLLELWVIDENERALAVYERAGWVATDERQEAPQVERRLVRELPVMS